MYSRVATRSGSKSCHMNLPGLFCAGIGSVIKQSVPEDMEMDDDLDDPNEVRASLLNRNWVT
jgi:hypothetical protein